MSLRTAQVNQQIQFLYLIALQEQPSQIHKVVWIYCMINTVAQSYQSNLAPSPSFPWAWRADICLILHKDTRDLEDLQL